MGDVLGPSSVYLQMALGSDCTATYWNRQYLHSVRQHLLGVFCWQSGLSRLAEAASTVDEMGRTAETQRALLKVKQEEADDALGHIQSSMETAAERRKEMEVLGRELGDKQVVLQEQKGG